MSKNITYRLFQDSDLPGVLRLWEKESGWGTLTPEKWRSWYQHTPYGDALIVVAVDEEGEIAGQEVFLPSRLVIENREVKALRLSAPILRKDLRQDSLRAADHPVVNLYLTAITSAIAHQYEVIYSWPEHGWLPIFRWLPRFGLPRFECAEYECMALSPGDLAVQSDKFIARPVERFGSEYEKLWHTARASYPIHCGVKRSPAWLQYRNGAHLTLAVHEQSNDALVGYVAINRHTGLLVDFLAHHPSQITDVLATVIHHVGRRQGNTEQEIPTVLKALRTPLLSDALRTLGFMPIDFKFAFVCVWRDSDTNGGLSAEAINPENWYLMPGD